MTRRKDNPLAPWIVLPAAVLFAGGLMWWSIGSPFAASPGASAAGVVDPPQVATEAKDAVDPALRYRQLAQVVRPPSGSLQPADMATDKVPTSAAARVDQAAVLRTADLPANDSARAAAKHQSATALLQLTPLDAIADLQDVVPDSAERLATGSPSVHEEAAPSSPVSTVISSTLDKPNTLPFREAVRLSDALMFAAGDDTKARSDAARLALDAVERDLSTRRQGDPGAAEALAVLARLPEADMWAANDGRALERMFRLRLAWLETTDANYGWARTGLAGAAYLQGRHSEALSTATALLQDRSLRPSQRTEAYYDCGLALYAMDKFDEAAGALRVAAADRTFHHADDASFLLLYVHARSGDVAGTAACLQDYLARRPSGVQEEERRNLVSSLTDELSRAKAMHAVSDTRRPDGKE